MSEFMDEAEQLAGEHSDVADKGIEEAGQMVDDKTGGHFDSEVQQGSSRSREISAASPGN